MGIETEAPAQTPAPSAAPALGARIPVSADAAASPSGSATPAASVAPAAGTPPSTNPAPPAPLAAPSAGPAAAGPEEPAEPFAFADFTWLNGSNRQHKSLLDSPYFTGSFLLDVNYAYGFNRPIDDTVVGSTAISRYNELTIQFVGFGGDFHYEHARGRFMTQFGLRSTQIPRNDGSINRGQFDLATALRYISEAYGGYHSDALHGINLDVGIFMSYVGLFSYAAFENWAYQPSFTSDNTPWFFNGARLQVFPSETIKTELWVINGWQTYGKFNEMPGFGFQVLWRPIESFEILSNGYWGWDTQNNAGRLRIHSDNSMELRYYNRPKAFFHRAAFSVTADIGFENGDGVVPFGGSGTEWTDSTHTKSGCTLATPCEQNFVSGMIYHRMWFFDDHIGWTVGGGGMHNPGRYLVLAPTGQAQPSAVPHGFDMNVGSKFNAWDVSTTLAWMPDEQQTWMFELVHREASVPYFAGHGGVTSPDGYVTTPVIPGWKPDLVKTESKFIASLLLRF